MAQNTALLVLYVTGVILVDCSTTESSSFLHVNVSGGEPLEVQDSVSGKPTATVTVDVDGVSTTGAATGVYRVL